MNIKLDFFRRRTKVTDSSPSGPADQVVMEMDLSDLNYVT